MVNLRAILSSYFVTLPVLGTDIVSVAEGPGCSGAVLQIPSTIGCTKMGGLGASTLEVLGTRSTENQDPGKYHLLSSVLLIGSSLKLDIDS